MTLSPVPTVNSQRQVHGIARRSSGDFFAAFADGKLYRAAPGSNTLAPVTNFPAIPTSSQQFVDLAASGNDLFVLRVGTVLHCNGACTDFADFTVVHNIAFGPQVWGLCARGESAYFVTQATSVTQLHKLVRNGSTLSFEQISSDVGTNAGEDCTIDEDGNVFIAGREGTAVMLAAGGSQVQQLNLNGHMQARWTSVAVSSSHALMVGGGGGMRVARRVNGDTFSDDAPVATGPLLNVALTLGETEFLAAGAHNGGTGATVYRYDGNTFVPWSPAPPFINAVRGLAVSADDVFLAGTNSNDNAYVILHGTR